MSKWAEYEEQRKKKKLKITNNLNQREQREKRDKSDITISNDFWKKISPTTSTMDSLEISDTPKVNKVNAIDHIKKILIKKQ